MYVTYVLLKYLRDNSDQEAARLAWQNLVMTEGTDFAACFMGMLQSSVQCQLCTNVRVTFDPFWDITVACPQVGVCMQMKVSGNSGDGR